MEINTPDDWWKAVDENWKDLFTIVLRFPSKDCQKSLKDLVGEISRPFAVRVTEAKENRNWEELHSIFQTAWHNAPDKPYIHDIPGWEILCDLCSEVWVFGLGF